MPVTYNDAGVPSEMVTAGKISLKTNTIHWTLKDFFKLPQSVGAQIVSERFVYDGILWDMYLYPSGCRYLQSVGWLGMHVYGTYAPDTYHVRFGILDEDGKEIASSDALWDASLSSYTSVNIMSRSDFESKKEQMVPGGLLRAFCEIDVGNSDEEEASVQSEAQVDSETAETSDEISEGTGGTSPLPESIIRLQQELKALLLNGKNSDVTVKVINRKFKAHRNILAARSPVFSNLLEKKNTPSGTLTIEDIHPDVFQDFLHYLYIGSVENLNLENVWSLYDAGEKYRVDDLKKVCVRHMINCISIENFCDMASFAFKHGEERLVSAAADFFAKKGSEIVVTGKWRAFQLKDLEASNRLLAKALRVKKPAVVKQASR